MKKYANSALIYAILAMVGGVFFREFTKFNGFEGATTLAFVHTHYFALGMIVFLLLVLLENALHITDSKVSRAVTAYHIGLNATARKTVRFTPSKMSTMLTPSTMWPRPATPEIAASIPWASSMPSTCGTPRTTSIAAVALRPM